MKNKDFIKLLAEYHSIKDELQILDPKNHLENKTINSLRFQLEDILSKISKLDRQEQLTLLN